MGTVTFTGAGSFGTVLSILLAEKGNEIRIWDRKQTIVDEINLQRKNTKYLKDTTLPDNITAFNDIKEAASNCDFLVLSVPSHAIKEISFNVKNIIRKDTIIVNIAKGIEEKSKKRLSEVIRSNLSDNPIVVLSGPSHAEEIAKRVPTTVVSSSENMYYAEIVQDLFMTPEFRVYTNKDIIGVEIGGAVKNIIALASGILDGLGYGDNSKAALMTRGMNEIIRIGEKLGGQKETFFGLTGMGDLIVTCTSMHSRNRRAGILIGKGETIKDSCNQIGMVVEGIKATKAFYELKESLHIDMPITDKLYKVLFEEKECREAINELMLRDKKSESF